MFNVNLNEPITQSLNDVYVKQWQSYRTIHILTEDFFDRKQRDQCDSPRLGIRRISA